MQAPENPIGERDIKRKLATIMVADIVAYSRLTAQDEDGTIRRLGEFRDVVDQMIAKHDGRIFNTGGDSVLAEFASPVEAVRCAVDFQEAARSRNILQPADRQLRFRIGINLGDVLVRGTDLLGDGVNVAARLEGLAEPGGICVSGTVWDHIHGKLSLGYLDIGEQTVKNIPRPIRAYQLRVDGSVEEVAAGAPRSAAAASSTPRFLVPALAGGLVLVLAAAGGLAWQLWPRSAPPTRAQVVAPPARTATPPETAASRQAAPLTAPPVHTSAPVAAPGGAAPAGAGPAVAPAAQSPQVAALVPRPAPAKQVGETFRDCPNCPEMVVLPAGHFLMGSDAAEHERFQGPQAVTAHEQPQHEVTIAKPFSLAKFDVTRGEFAAFLKATDFHPQKECMVLVDGRWVGNPELDWENPGFVQTDRDPVVCVNGFMIEAYLLWLRRQTGKPYRLPSEAEWEYAARAGTTTPFYWGTGPGQVCQYENVADQTAKETFTDVNFFAMPCRDGFAYTAPVGSFKPNQFGLFDMAGNVSVYTEDCWNDGYTGAPTDGSAWTSGVCASHAARKASFGNGRPFFFRTAHRMPDGFGSKRNRTGFRVALSLP
jgi:formylglycine-generating enzyme required for sulfatase activity/class 3 adenylate cyclase